MTSTVEKITKIVWKISEDAFEDGRRQERNRILEMLGEEIAKQEQAASTLDETGILIGLKRAELHVKELKWT
jgi:hypothetical protein